MEKKNFAEPASDSGTGEEDRHYLDDGDGDASVDAPESVESHGTKTVSRMQEISSQGLIQREHAERAARFLKGMANPGRLTVLCHLLKGEMNVGALQQETRYSQPVISQHLARLRAESIVSGRRQGQQVYYSISNEEARSLLDLLCNQFTN